MDQLIFHPKVVHLPIALAVLMPLISGGVLLGLWRGWFDRRVWILVFSLQAVLVGSGMLAMNTGEHEEERVEEVVAERHIEAHEEAAEAFVWAAAALLVLMAGPLVLKEGKTGQAISLAAFLGTLFVLGLGFKAGEAGGRLVYEHGAAQVYVTGDAGTSTFAGGDQSGEGDSDSD